MLNHQLLEFREALESFATRQLANHIDRTRFAGAVPGNLTVDFLAIVFLKLHVAPAAAQVEILKREPQRIHLLMAH